MFYLKPRAMRSIFVIISICSFSVFNAFADGGTPSPFSNAASYPPSTIHFVINDIQLKEYTGNFYSKYSAMESRQVFATQYTIPLADIAWCQSVANAGGSVRVFNGLDNGKKSFILCPLNFGYFNISLAQYPVLGADNLCPPNCDFDGGAASQGSKSRLVSLQNCKTATQAYYSQSVSGKQYDNVNGFVLDQSVIKAVSVNGAVAIKCYFGLNAKNNRMMIFAGADQNGNIVSDIIMYDDSGMCPTNCD